MSQPMLHTDAAGATRLGQTRRNINMFLDSPWFIALVGLLTVISNVFGADLIVYSLFILFAIYIALLGTDFLPLTTLVICCYLSPSVHNNPGKNEGSIFFPQNGGIYLACLFLLFLSCTVFRLITDRELGGKHFWKRSRKLLPGMVLLGGAYLLGGAFSGRYFSRGVLAPVFALLQFAAIAVPYWFLAGAVRWERVRRDYFGWVGLVVGLAVSCEVVGIYATNNVVTNGLFDVRNIFTGWGNKNNVGAIIAMMIPLGLSLVRREKWGWVFNVLTMLMLLALCYSCSRTSILFGILFYLITLTVMLFDKKWRKKVLLNVGISSAVLLALLAVLFYGHIYEFISKFWNWDTKSVGDRFSGYQKGIQAFQDHPVFGETFYPSQKIFEWSTVEALTAVLPARWHNTFIQLLASCGILGLGCYLFHRFQTVRLFWKKRRTEGLYIGLSLLCLLVMSLLDCHFFNIGPALFYSMGLAFAEKNQETPG